MQQMMSPYNWVCEQTATALALAKSLACQVLRGLCLRDIPVRRVGDVFSIAPPPSTPRDQASEARALNYMALYWSY